MKNHFFKVLLLSILTATYLGCSSDSDSDNCETISCQNGGTFVDCACDCPQGYTGNNCSTQVSPTSIRITKVTVRLFPVLNQSGEQWDQGVGDEVNPDLYFQLIKPQNILLYDSPTFFENANIVDNHTFSLDNPIIITDLTTPYIISLFDYDTIGQDDNMASQTFFIYENDNDFPETITILDSEQPIAVDLEINYEF